MELLDGHTLQDYISQIGPVSFDRTKKPIIEMLHGLNAAHTVGVIHRDLKPSNVIITKGKNARVKIIDFGISAYLENEKHIKLTKTGEHFAGGSYSDPVLIHDNALRDIRSDLYSVGAIWYYLLVGQSPTGVDPKRILLESGNATEFQSEIVFKCLANKPQDRYQSCEELLSILNQSNITPSPQGVFPKRITEITRGEIFELLERSSYLYYGKLECITFLSRLYDLKGMLSNDPRMKTFEEEIYQHKVANDDYIYEWVFQDKRLGLRVGNDEVLLKFICEVFHPAVRSEKINWNSTREKINDQLKIDGYELYESEKISGRSVYSYRYCI
ncbi:protein kinase [Paenibacillus frigoriresistens]|nr:protein kinase [Paenibacillus frigoriresistens]